MSGIKLFTLALITFCLLNVSQSYPTFAQYRVLFNKTYTVQQANFRQGVYNSKIASFANIVNYTPGVNNFTDWTEEQFRGTPFFIIALQTLSSASSTQRVSSSPIEPARVGSPTSLDWRDSNIVTSIKNQGNCGACWAFTSAAVAESFLVQKGKQSISINLSQQRLLQCTTGSDCRGGFIEDGLDSIKNSCPTESQYSYSPSSNYSSSICSASGVETKFKRSSYYNLADSELITLLQKGPVAVAVSSVGWDSYSSGVLSCSSSATVDHAVVAIGYTSTAIVIKNSWGTSWGISGYGLVSRNSLSNCKITDQAHIVESSWESKKLIVLSVLVLVILMIVY